MHLRIVVIRRKISQKTIRALQFCSARNRLQSQFKNGGSSFKNTRIVHNSNLPHLVSSNGKLDYYNFKKLSCAEVLKHAIKNDRVNGSTQCTSLQNTIFNPVIKTNVHKVCTKASLYLPIPLLLKQRVTKGHKK